MSDIAKQVAELHRQHYRGLIAPLIRLLGSFEMAEDVVQDTFTQALQSWRQGPLPDEPLAWLRRVAKNRAIDRSRSQRRQAEKQEVLVRELDSRVELEFSDAFARDDTLRLVFTCCHPSLSAEAQVGLTLRTVCGLTSQQVARAFLLKPQTLQQRLVRAQRKIDQAKIPYVIPDRETLPERTEAVLRTIYLVFNEGYGASDGDTLIRRELCDEAIRLGRLLSGLMPESGSAKALLALMLLHHSRRAARITPAGDLVTLEDQDRSLWDQELIAEAMPLVESGLKSRPLSTYAIEAAIAALHAQAKAAHETDWVQIAALYSVLEQLTAQSPIVALNSAVALAMAGNLEQGLERLQALEADGGLTGYHLLPSALGELLSRAGRLAEARDAFGRALDLVTNPVERRFIQARLRKLAK